MSVKGAGVGHFTIPTAPAAGTSITSGAANTFSSSYVQLIASTAAALYITGVYMEGGSASPTYHIVQLASGAAGSETIIGQYLVSMQPTIAGSNGFRPIFPPIPVAASTRIAAKTADSTGSLATLITLECIAQSNVVDDGITVGTVNLVNTTTTVTNQLTAAAIATGVWKDATAADFAVSGSIGLALFANAAPGAAGGHFIAGTNAATTITTALTANITGNVTGNLSGSVGSVSTRVTANTDQLAGQAVTAAAGVTFPSSVASPTNITAGTITTVTNLTNAPTAGDFTAAMKTSLNAATPTCTVSGDFSATMKASLNASTPASVTGAVGSVTGSVGSVVGLTAANLDVAVSSRFAAASYIAPDNTSIAAIKLKTDNLPADPADESLIISATTAIMNTLGAPAGASVSADIAAVKTDTAGIKVQTDALSFTIPGKLDANITYVNGIQVNGNGQAATPWGP